MTTSAAAVPLHPVRIHPGSADGPDVLEGPSSTQAPAASAAGALFAPGTGEVAIGVLEATANLPVRPTRWHDGSQIRPDMLAAFAAWLATRVVFVQPRASSELLRFRTALGIGCVTRDKRAATRISGAASAAWNAFATGADWIEGELAPVAGLPDERVRRKRRIAFVRGRDGDKCVFCGRVVASEDESLEHFVATGRGGLDVPANWALAHERCNTHAGDMPVPAKIDLALKLRGVVPQAAAGRVTSA